MIRMMWIFYFSETNKKPFPSLSFISLYHSHHFLAAHNIVSAYYDSADEPYLIVIQHVFPAAAEGFVEGDEVEEGCRFALEEVLLRLVKGALCVDEVEEAGEATRLALAA